MDIVGVGFRPTEEELVDYYLKHKLLGDDPRVLIIPVIELCDVEPWEVPVILAKSVIPFGNPEWFFFSPVDFKYPKSKRVNRTTKLGYWKATGVDRDVRSWETNTVIARKKCLVYHKGRVPNGVNSFWVIHEYHAVTFHESKRKFVLCRLKKPEKTTDGGTDALICDEGEPSGSMVGVYEHQATAEAIPFGGTPAGMEAIYHPIPWTEKYFSQVQQYPSVVQEETPFSDYPFNNAYFRNENIITQTSFETIVEDEFSNSTLTKKYFLQQCPTSVESVEKYLSNNIYFRNEDSAIHTSFEIIKQDQFINSILNNESSAVDEENRFDVVNHSTQPESLTMVYGESNTDAEVVSRQDRRMVNFSTIYNKDTISDEYHPSKRLKSSHDVVNNEMYLSSSICEASLSFCDFGGVDTSSSDSTANKYLEINCIEISSFPSIL